MNHSSLPCSPNPTPLPEEAMDCFAMVAIVGTEGLPCEVPRTVQSKHEAQEAFAVAISVLITPGVCPSASALAAFTACHTRTHVHGCPEAAAFVSSHSSAGEYSCLWCRVVVMIQTLLYPKQIVNFSSMEKRIHYKIECFLKGLQIFFLTVNHVLKHLGNKYNASIFSLIMTK